MRAARQIRPVRRQPPPFQLGDLAAFGAGDPTAQKIIGTGGSIATAALPFIAAAGPAAPFVAIGVVVASLLASMIGGGCGSACIDASKAEQIYEAATDNLWATYKAGMVSKAQFLNGAKMFLQSGQQHMATFGTSQAKKGMTNMANVINAMISGAGAVAPPAPAPVDFGAAHALYVSGGGWYPDSLQAAAQLTDAFLQQYGNTASGSAASAVSALTSSTVFGIPLWILAAGAGLFWFMRRN
jgi:hypothetical protein